MNMFLNPSWVETLVSAVMDVINPILILVATAGIIYAIVVGVKFAKAEYFYRKINVGKISIFNNCMRKIRFRYPCNNARRCCLQKQF